MLSGQALTFYYSNRKTADITISYTEFWIKIQNFLDGLEWQRLNLAKWQTISLFSLIAANSTLSTTECLRKLCTEMDEIQRGISIAFQGNEHLRENIIRACRDHAALSVGLINPPNDVSGLIDNLNAFIVNYEAVYKPSIANAGYLQEDDDELFFVDCQFRRKQQQWRGRGRGSRYPQTFRSAFRKEKCFVCNRENCWSTNHTQQERDDANKSFDDRYPHLKARANYNQKLSQHITDLKRQHGDDDEIIQYFEEFSDRSARKFKVQRSIKS